MVEISKDLRDKLVAVFEQVGYRDRNGLSYEEEQDLWEQFDLIYDQVLVELGAETPVEPLEDTDAQ